MGSYETALDLWQKVLGSFEKKPKIKQEIIEGIALCEHMIDDR